MQWSMGKTAPFELLSCSHGIKKSIAPEEKGCQMGSSAGYIWPQRLGQTTAFKKVWQPCKSRSPKTKENVINFISLDLLYQKHRPKLPFRLSFPTIHDMIWNCELFSIKLLQPHIKNKLSKLTTLFLELYHFASDYICLLFQINFVQIYTDCTLK